jgi:hypothetical protein
MSEGERPRTAPWAARGTALVALAWVLAACAAHGQAPPQPQPAAEASGWTRLTTYAEVEEYYRDLVSRSPDARITRIGESREGRSIYKVVLARHGAANPVEAHRTGKPIVVLAAQVHGNEPASKEGLMLFARDVVLGPLASVLDHVTLVLVPQINPDAAEAGAWGTRANAAGYNVNRDYLRLVNPETRAIVRNVLVPWQPHVVVDIHETTGPPRVYDFYTQHAEDLSGPWAPARFAADSITPAIVDALAREGFDYFIYHVHGEPDRIPVDGVTIGLYGARNLRNYGGAHGAISILFESLRQDDARVDIGRRAAMQRAALEGLVSYVADNAASVIAAVQAGRTELRERGARWDPTDSIAIRVDLVPRTPVPYRMGEMVYDHTADDWRATGRISNLVVPLADSTVVRLARTRPLGYLIDRHRTDLVAHLLAHGVEVERLARPATIQVETLVPDSITRAHEPWEGFLPRTVWSSTVPEVRGFQEGTFLVRSSQRLAPILFQLLEPEDEDSFASTGWLSAEKSVGRALPVYRVTGWPDDLRAERWVPAAERF